MNDLSEAKILPRSNLEEMVRKFVADNNIHAVYGKDVEGLHIVHFLVDEEEEDETLELSEAEKLDLNNFFLKEIQSFYFLSHEVQDNKEHSELYWSNERIGDRMFDLCIDFNDHKMTCVVYECDGYDCEDGSVEFETNFEKSLILYEDLDAFQLAELQGISDD
ncbi:MAG: hypothetical protein CBD86_03275 [Gammaproteobacteria bacterium TMED226]|nr:MAG: hypothetical protein CBD86_03275 [Gammaproteobacteria bacterium TMED226]|tara:strand:- start:147 stop:635 length:489 start_codon:yes stop_codon:yes gene_type:complete